MLMLVSSDWIIATQKPATTERNKAGEQSDTAYTKYIIKICNVVVLFSLEGSGHILFSFVSYNTT